MSKNLVGALVVVLIVIVVVWFGLAHLALYARTTGAPTGGKTTEDYDQATEWATGLLGLASTLAGFLGIAAASRENDLKARRQNTQGGLVGIVAGATLLGAGGAPVSYGLAALAVGAAMDAVVQTYRQPP